MYHPNYNPEFKNKNGPQGWFCISCKTGLQVIEYCLQCPRCGLIIIKNLWQGWNDHHSLPRRGRRVTPQSSSYDYRVHYKNWMGCILAREEITPALEKVIKDVRNEWRRYPMITCIDSIRNVLKKLGHNKHYKHAPLILKRVSGVGPPDIPDNILRHCNFIFSDVMRAYIQCFSSSNSAGYPYIIYKIFDAILPNSLRRVMEYIHLQRTNTITKRDKEWDVICDYIPYLKEFVSEVPRN